MAYESNWYQYDDGHGMRWTQRGHLMDPYATEADLERYERIKRADSNYLGLMDEVIDRLWFFGPGFVGALVLTIIGFMLGWPSEGWFVALAPLYLTPVVIAGTAGRTALAAQGLAAAEQKVVLQHYPRTQVAEIGAKLKTLTPAERAELRPLWDAALAADEVLNVDPTNNEALDILDTRVKAVGDFVAAKRAFEAKLAKSAQNDKVKALLTSLPATDEDVLIAQHMSESLTAGTAALAELESS